MTIKAAIKNLLEGVRKAYRKDLQRFRATGNTSKELRIESSDRKGALYAPGHIMTLIFGRKPGKMPPISAMLDWIRAKRIKPRDPKTSERSLAYIFAKTIAEKGNRVFRGEVAPLNVDEEIKELNEKFMQEMNKQIKMAISRSLVIILLCCSCSASINLTQAQKERKKFERFKIAPREHIILGASFFAAHGFVKHNYHRK